MKWVPRNPMADLEIVHRFCLLGHDLRPTPVHRLFLLMHLLLPVNLLIIPFRKSRLKETRQKLG